MEKTPHQTNPDWFKMQFQKKGLSLRKVAAAIGVSPAKVSKSIHGYRHFKIAELAALARILDKSVAEIAYASGELDTHPDVAPEWWHHKPKTKRPH